MNELLRLQRAVQPPAVHHHERQEDELHDDDRDQRPQQQFQPDNNLRITLELHHRQNNGGELEAGDGHSSHQGADHDGEVVRPPEAQLKKKKKKRKTQTPKQENFLEDSRIF